MVSQRQSAGLGVDGPGLQALRWKPIPEHKSPSTICVELFTSPRVRMASGESYWHVHVFHGPGGLLPVWQTPLLQSEPNSHFAPVPPMTQTPVWVSQFPERHCESAEQ